jgi:hypothetical protein
MTMDPEAAVEVARAAINGTSAETLRSMLDGLQPGERAMLHHAALNLLQAGRAVDEIDVDTARTELARSVGTSSFAAAKGDYQASHRIRDDAFIAALGVILRNPETAAEFAAIALSAIDEGDEKYYDW